MCGLWMGLHICACRATQRRQHATLAWCAPAGVFDGHGHEGRLAAAFAAREVPKHLAADARVAEGASNKQWTAAFTDACVAVPVCRPCPS